LRDALVARGVEVIMIRTTQKVDISNAQRARIANAAHADLFIRLHCDGSTKHAITGVLTLVPAKNKWTAGIVTASARAGRDLQSAVLAATHAKNRGIVKRGDLTGFNWSKVPVALVEMGMMSNPAEDRALASPAYQTKLATGIADGVMAFRAGK
jgi:N-acetylmuramoyl-L-alanine amidase